MQIITGKTGTNHVAAEDDRALHAATIGSGNYVLNSGLKFEATIETSNNIVLAEGDLLINGTHARIRHGETETVIIENGTTGYNRIDLIVARYTKSAGIEDVSLVVVKGEPTTGTATQPTTDYIGLNVLDGVEIVDMPLYAVQLSGVNVTSVKQLFEVSTGLDDVYRKQEMIDLIYPVGSIYMSVNNVNPSKWLGGTWIAWGSGRVPVGVNTSDTAFSTVEKTGGAKTHTLTEQEMPTHTHGAKSYYVVSGGSLPVGYVTDVHGGMYRDTSVSGLLTDAGGGQAHNNLQPYITCYMWKRTV